MSPASSPAVSNAAKFFHACESLQGAIGCRQFMQEGATFEAQSEPVAEFETAAQYVDWLQAIGTTALKGCSYELHSSSYDEATRCAIFFSTFVATHGGEGGPVPATGRSTRSHYVYVLTMGADDRVSHMVKIWNAPWAMRELGWMA